MAKRKRTNNDLENITQNIEQCESHYKPGVNSCIPEGLVFPAPLVTP
jgi:hypothetical protein